MNADHQQRLDAARQAFVAALDKDDEAPWYAYYGEENVPDINIDGKFNLRAALERAIEAYEAADLERKKA